MNATHTVLNTVAMAVSQQSRTASTLVVDDAFP